MARRRGIGFRLAVLVCLALLLPACTSPREEVRIIRFWNGFTGPDGRTMLRMVRRFNRENPDVRVLMQRMDWATYHNKLFVAGLGGRAPEVFILYPSMLPRFMQADFLRPLDDLVDGPNGIDAEDFVPAVWDAVSIDGRHYSIPLDIPTIGMYYNKKLFREAGIVDEHGEPRPPTGRTDFLEAARALTRDFDGDGRPDQWGYGFTWFRINVMALMKQWNGELFSPDGKTCVLAGPENVDCLRFCHDLIEEERVAPPPQDFASWIGFRQGKIGMVFEGIWMVAELEKQTDLECGYAPLPCLGSQPAAWATSHTLCMRRGLDPADAEAAWRFIRFLSDNALEWAAGGQIPARRSQIASPPFQAMEAQAVFARQLSYVHFDPPVPFILEFLTEYDAAVERALRGSMSPEASLRVAAENTDAAVRRYYDMRARAGKDN